MQDVKALRLRVHRNNLDRYARLLSTHLTETERAYIHRRIAEEHASLTRIEAEYMAENIAGNADPKTLIAARAAARKTSGQDRVS